jgi:hypothetical protein
MNQKPVPWLVILFSLPAKRASARVEIWRRLKRLGALPLRGSGYLLPASADNAEHFEWLAQSIRRSGGTASVLSVAAIDDLPRHRVRKLFIEARSQDYQQLIGELKRIKTKEPGPALARLRKRFEEIKAIDFFGGPMQRKTEAALSVRERPRSEPSQVAGARKSIKEFRGRLWLTRPRPGIDRAACAWLILHFIDPKARFRFANDPAAHPDAIAFDMFHAGGFSHRGDDCSFETLVKEFRLKRRSLQVLAEMIHDADLKDDKFGRNEAVGIERVLKGWASQGMKDDDLLTRGMGLIDGLHRSV